MTLDPEAAVAASICFLSRTNRTGLLLGEGRHPRACEWCDYQTPDLIAMVEEFNVADMDGRVSASFRRLSPKEQRSLVDAALYQVTA